VLLADGREAFVKTRPGVPSGEYAAEARGLRWLAEPAALGVPEVLDVNDGYLALAWIERGALSAAGEEQLGRGLATVHAAGAPHFGDPSAPLPGDPAAHESARIGSLRLPNEPAETWPAFYVERRLRPLTKMAAERGVVSTAAVRALERVCERMDVLAGPAEPPARLHGDLWWGNVLGDAAGRPWLIDPSAYGGHREVDLAMLRLFGGPRERVFDAYAEAHPLADGFEHRVELWQLLPLLVHAVLFGGSYGAAAEQAARRYV
jgi:fructosamine-3-kinase